jgi:hypothetical protein
MITIRLLCELHRNRVCWVEADGVDLARLKDGYSRSSTQVKLSSREV